MDAFANSEEFYRRFGRLSNADLVNTIFLQLFGRNADSSGLDFYAVLGVDENFAAGAFEVTGLAGGIEYTLTYAFDDSMQDEFRSESFTVPAGSTTNVHISEDGGRYWLISAKVCCTLPHILNYPVMQGSQYCSA